MLYFLIWVGGFILVSLIGAAVYRAITSPYVMMYSHNNQEIPMDDTIMYVGFLVVFFIICVIESNRKLGGRQ